ncbi:MAG: thioredoxin [Firmicutes bacterium]|nr:thioredoxin [Bacillota bacterium]
MEAKRRTQLRIAVLAAGIAFLAAGIFRGEFSDVLAKAMRICLECIGIG